MIKVHSIFCSIILFAQTLIAQPIIQWQNTIGGNANDQLQSVQQTSDGGYIAGGFSFSNITGDKTEDTIGGYDYWIIKTNDIGGLLWQNTIGGNGNDYLNSVQQTADNGYIIAGYSESGISGDKTENHFGESDYWVLKLDSNGIIKWQNTIGGDSADQLCTVRRTFDGGYILGGSSNSSASVDKTESSHGLFDYWVVKIDSLGSILWQNTIGGAGNDMLQSVRETSDGGYILGGYSDSDSSGDKTEYSIGLTDYWIVKIDSLGNIQWENTIGGSDYDFLYTAQQTNDLGYIIGGSSFSSISGDKTEDVIGFDDYWVLKLDALGNIQWQNTIGGDMTDRLRSIQQTSDNGYLLAGHSNSDISGDKSETSLGSYDYWMVRTDSSGMIKWQNTIGGNEWEEMRSMQITIDGGYILGGYSRSNISGDKTENCQGFFDYWLVKLYNDSITGISSSSIVKNNSFRVYPNPAVNFIEINLKNLLSTENFLMICDYSGKTIYEKEIENVKMNIDISGFSKGIYYVRLLNNHGQFVTKFVKE